MHSADRMRGACLRCAVDRDTSERSSRLWAFLAAAPAVLAAGRDRPAWLCADIRWLGGDHSGLDSSPGPTTGRDVRPERIDVTDGRGFLSNLRRRRAADVVADPKGAGQGMRTFGLRAAAAMIRLPRRGEAARGRVTAARLAGSVAEVTSDRFWELGSANVTA